MKNVFTVAMLMVAASVCAGCATAFTGSAFVEDGRGGCETKCKAQGMAMVGMVYMGEYSDACVCALPGQGATVQRGLGAVAGGASGVVLQARRQQQNSSSY
jgi:hypothetical protein